MGEFSSSCAIFILQFQCKHFVVLNITIEIKKGTIKMEATVAK
jgi:hypothetical protein